MHCSFRQCRKVEDLVTLPFLRSALVQNSNLMNVDRATCHFHKSSHKIGKTNPTLLIPYCPPNLGYALAYRLCFLIHLCMQCLRKDGL